MVSKSAKRWTSTTVMMMVIAAVIMAGCSKNANSNLGQSPVPSNVPAAGESTGSVETEVPIIDTSEKVQFTIEVPDLVDLVGKNDRITKFITDKFNLDLKLIGPPWGEQMNKLRLLMVSGDVPDAFSTFGTGNEDHENWVRDGLVLDITEIAKKYPNIQAVLDNPNFASLKKDGKWYGIPKYFDGVLPHALQVRQDWLDDLGLKAPQTTDELYEVLKQIVAQEPSGKKTVGLSVDSLNVLNEYFIPLFTGINGWGIMDGKYQFGAAVPGYKDYLKYMNKLYSEKLLDPDFLMNKTNQSVEKFVSGRAGIIYNNIDAFIFNKNYDSLLQNFPNAKMEIIGTPIQGPAGGFQPANPVDSIAMLSFSSKLKNPDRMFQFIDYLLSPEGQTLTRYGLEGVHYTKDGDQIKVKQEEIDKDKEQSGEITWSTGVHVIHIITSYDYTRFLPESTPRRDQLSQAFEETHTNPLRNPVIGFTSETMTNNMPQIFMTVDEYTSNFILGKLDIDSNWDKYIADLRNKGLDVIEKEVNEYMAAQ